MDSAGSVRPGLVVHGIRFERKLDEGGVGEVWLARHERLNRPVAVKVLRSDLSRSDPQLYRERVERLEREARLLAQFDHEAIVAIYDLIDVDDSVGLAMEFVPYATLRAYIAASGGSATAEHVIEVVRGAAVALDLVHSPPIQMVHRDISPRNIFWAPGKAVKIADFGVAQVAAEATRSVNSIRDHPGTPLYMSPEQRNRLPLLDGRSDQYSLAQCVYEMATGHIYSETFSSIDVERPDLPEYLRAAILRALSDDRVERFLTCGEFASALSSPSVARDTVWSQLTDPGTVLAERGAGVSRHARVVAAGLLIGALALAANAGVALTGRGLGSSSPQPTTSARTSLVASPSVPTSATALAAATPTPSPRPTVAATPTTTPTPTPFIMPTPGRAVTLRDGVTITMVELRPQTGNPNTTIEAIMEIVNSSGRDFVAVYDEADISGRDDVGLTYKWRSPFLAPQKNTFTVASGGRQTFRLAWIVPSISTRTTKMVIEFAVFSAVPDVHFGWAFR